LKRLVQVISDYRPRLSKDLLQRINNDSKNKNGNKSYQIE